MRERFESVGQLLAYYEYIKCGLESAPTLMPKKDHEQRLRKNAARIAQSNLEDRLCFVAEVELCIRAYHDQLPWRSRIPLDCLNTIWSFMTTKSLSRYKTFGELARHFRHRIDNKREQLPGKLRSKGHLLNICKDIRAFAIDYYPRVGLCEGRGHLDEVFRELSTFREPNL